MSAHGVLIVDDEVKLCRNIAIKLEKEGYTTYQAYDGKSAIDLVRKHPISVVLLDYMLNDMTGLDVLSVIKREKPNTIVFMLTAYGNIESAVMAMKGGAADYFNKPVELRKIKEVVDSVCRTLPTGESSEDTIIFANEKMKQIRRVLEQVTPTDAIMLLLGESGVGKTALAKWIHQYSHRKDKPFVCINCASIPETLLESELFGYAKGAFTGAAESRPGKFEAANGGTIFLDEIGEISPAMQAKLLHVIEEKTVTRLGSHASLKVDVRILAATNKPLKQLVQQGRFREDLYYRLNVVEIEIPPLRERREDIPLLVEQTLRKLNEKYGKTISISSELMKMLLNEPWPGNIRELINTLERMHILKESGTLDVQDFAVRQPVAYRRPVWEEIPLNDRLQDVLDEVEEHLIREAIRRAGGNHTKAAHLLGISRNTLIYKLKKMRRP
ncbi:sigma-54-dependent Fis family transcriptional regulator [Brevibacillus sp. LEMMJ03]|jgi:two-component system, NtrC family, response regulator AtoC|uniref:sigma-54-dependent transcriptional regulator n=1 Tax=Brevibacillus sp. LEMMJ03 TaxID=2595056 RepID=UPI001180030D|nr:sigma-54 dependent transcriptional regulator [Brevibacillus sp. LEMMJ03]TRY26545.1 sigma-54-dependent Fis family transcriptional regulator [Brevibacillus sp. LEMMJ03]